MKVCYKSYPARNCPNVLHFCKPCFRHRLNRIRQTICDSLPCCVALYLQFSTLHTEWQLPLSGVYSIMMEKLAQTGEGAPTISTISFKVVVYAPAETERADTLPLFLLYPCRYSVQYGEKYLAWAALFLRT